MSARAPIRFSGWICCRRDGEGPLGLILVGRTVDHPEEVVHFAFSCRAPQDLPDALEDATVERLDERRWRIASGGREWLLDCAGHLHREIAGAFYRAIPPRAVPWRKRLFWRVVLKLAQWRLVG
jgi:hypothetical protein